MKIVVFFKNWVGDTFFQFPAIRLIRNRYPDAQITCIAPPRCRELLAANPDISSVLEFDEKSTHRSWLKRLGFAFELRKLGPWDEGYLMHRSKTRAMLLKLAGVKKIFGYGKDRGFWLTNPVTEPEQSLHHVDYFMELMRGAGYEIPQDPSYELPVALSAAEKAAEHLKAFSISGNSHFVCFHLGANWEPKRWPAAHFAKLADLMHTEWNVPIVVTGSANDQPLFDTMKSFVKVAKIYSLIGKTPLDITAAVFSQAAFVVSGDSGPLHIAAAVGTPVLALFGPTNPDLTGPRGKGDAVILKYVPQGYSAPFFGDEAFAKKWLAGITPEQALNAIRNQNWLGK